MLDKAIATVVFGAVTLGSAAAIGLVCKLCYDAGYLDGKLDVIAELAESIADRRKARIDALIKDLETK